MNKKNPSDYLILALDSSSKDEIKNILKELKGLVSFFKIGLELFTAFGPEIIKEIKNEGYKIFFDGKFTDIPNTVSHAVSNIARHEVDLINIHLSGGIKMMQEAKKSIEKTCSELNISQPKLLGVIAVTSMNTEVLKNELQINMEMEDYMISQTILAYKNGIDGIICSPKEAKKIRESTSKDFLIVCPGIRPLWAEVNDQKRITTPKEAILNGVNYMVIGRPITHAKDRKEAAKKILSEIEEVV